MKDWISFIARRILNSKSRYNPVLDDYTLSHADALKSLLEHQESDSISWIGHATFLIKLGGKSILTDPFFSSVAGKFGLGPKRHTPPKIHIEDLPQIDIILCSHDHYDHLDMQSLTKIKNRFVTGIQIFCPLGLGKHFKQCGFTKITEMSWHENVRHENLELFCLPAVHNSGRSLFDNNKTLWCSFGIKSEKLTLYFSGDTAYHPQIFQDCGHSLDQCDLAILGIGAYAPEHLLGKYHTTPEQAAKIALDLNAKNVIGMHWGTISLSDEPVDEPIKRFAAALDSKSLWMIKIGETKALNLLRNYETTGNCSTSDDLL